MSRQRTRPVIHVTICARFPDPSLRDELWREAHYHGLSLSEYIALLLRQQIARTAVQPRPSRRPLVWPPGRSRQVLSRTVTNHLRVQRRSALLCGTPNPGIGRFIRGHRLEPYQPGFRRQFLLVPISPIPSQCRLPGTGRFPKR